VFVRALAASVCRTLKVDASQILALLPQTGKPRLGQPPSAINTPFRAPGDGPAPSIWAQISKPAVLAGLLLMMGALVLIFMPTAQQGGALSLLTPDTPVAIAVPTVAVRPQPVPSETAAAPVVVAEAPVAAIAPSAAPALAPTLSAVAAPVLPVEAAVPAAAALPLASGIIVFRAKGESWVEVTDAKKVVVLRRTLASGEEVGATGVLPLSAVVGRADATQVQVRGQAFDLTAVSKDNVARFEVK
jgi:cytoskeleton protein RodZ